MSSLSPLLNRKFIALLVVSFFSTFVSAPLNSLLPVYVESELARAPFFSASLRAVFLILGGLFAVPAGRLADGWGIKPVYLIGVLGPILTGSIFFTGDPLILTFLCTGIGISSGFNSAGGQSYLISSAPVSVIGIASAGYFLGNTLGAASGNLFAGPIADALGFQTLGICATVAGIGLIVLTVTLLPAIPAPKSSGQDRSLAGLVKLVKKTDVRLLLAIRFLPTSYWGGVTLLLPLLIYRLTGTYTAATTFTAISLSIAALFQVLTGRLCDRIGRWRPIITSSLMVAVSAIGLALFGQTLWGLYAFGIVAAASAWSLSTTMPGLIQLIADEGEKGRVVGAAHLSWSLGMLSGSLGAGKLIEWGPGWPFGIGFIFCLGALACALGLYRMYGRPTHRV
jgi:MFS transporter, YNFM family, putative membrane transport protein